MSRTTREWTQLLLECADKWELGDIYEEGPRQLLEDGSIIGTIAMHVSQHEEVVAIAPEALTEVIRLRRELEEISIGLERKAERAQRNGAYSAAVGYRETAKKITRILSQEGTNA